MFCTQCHSELKSYQQKYCSNLCQQEYQYVSYIMEWKKGKRDGYRGIKVKLISRHIKRYLVEKNKEKCSECGWSKRHKITGTVPLEIDHINGNAENNTESNLRLLCPNCHALTDNFRNLNRGQGRTWRK